MKSIPAVLRSPMTWLGVLIVVAGAVVFLSSDDPADTGDETAPVEITGDPLPAHDDPDPGIGMTVPTIEASLLDGGTIEIGPDTPRLLAFFAHWCPHCQAEMPVARNWYDTTTFPEGFEVLAVSTAVDASADNFPPSEWFAFEGWPTEVVLDDETSSIAAAYGLTRFPYWVAVDGDGAVVARVTGELTDVELDALVELATGENPS